MSSTFLVRTISAGSRRNALRMMGTTFSGSSGMSSLRESSHVHDDEDHNEEEEVAAEKAMYEATANASRKRQVPGNKTQSTSPSSNSSQTTDTTMTLSEDVLSSLSRSFETSQVDSDDEVPGRLAKLTDWTIDPDSAIAFFWKAAVTLAVIYNCTVIILRTAFADMRGERAFVILDFVTDAIYLLDIFIESKTSFLCDGSLVTDSRKTFMHYKGRPHFKNDIIAVCPTHTVIVVMASVLGLLNIAVYELAFFWRYFPIYQPILRLNRLLKCHAMENYFQRTESRTNKPNLLRAFKLSIHLGLVIHWIACLYYMLSEYEGFGLNEWVYPLDKGNTSFSKKYILCMFWSTMTLTTIGERPPPNTELEYIFTGLTFLIGVFVFAAVVGNVGDVISNMNAARRDFQARMDQIKFYMDHRNVPEHLQNRIKRWAEYTWDRTKAIDEANVLQFLPDRLRTEVAIHVHLKILKQVSIFDECEEGLLRELVLKLRPQIFSPGDYICRIGEIGREMYIINHGQVEILFPDSETGSMIQVAVMHAGNFFGEISLLKLDDGQNKRTADVRSVGFSELLCLSRRDLMVALTEYPEAKKILEEYARQRFNNTKKLTPPETEESRSTSPRLSASNLNKRSARQIFAQVMKQEGFKQLLTRASNNTELMEIKAAVDELKAARNSQAEDSFITMQKRIQELERQLLDKNLELQQSQAHVCYLETVVQRLTHTSGGGHVGGLVETPRPTRANSFSGTNLSFQWPDLHRVNTVSHHTQCKTSTGDSANVTGKYFFQVSNNDTDEVFRKGIDLNYCAQRRSTFRNFEQKKVNSNDLDSIVTSSFPDSPTGATQPNIGTGGDGNDNNWDSKDTKERLRKLFPQPKPAQIGPLTTPPNSHAHSSDQNSNVGHNLRTFAHRNISLYDSSITEAFSKSKIPVCNVLATASTPINSFKTSEKNVTLISDTRRDKQSGNSSKLENPNAARVQNKTRDHAGATCKNMKTSTPKKTTGTTSRPSHNDIGASGTVQRVSPCYSTSKGQAFHEKSKFKQVSKVGPASTHRVGIETTGAGRQIGDRDLVQPAGDLKKEMNGTTTSASTQPATGEKGLSKPRSASASPGLLSERSEIIDPKRDYLAQRSRSISLEVMTSFSSSDESTDFEEDSEQDTDSDGLEL